MTGAIISWTCSFYSALSTTLEHSSAFPYKFLGSSGRTTGIISHCLLGSRGLPGTYVICCLTHCKNGNKAGTLTCPFWAHLLTFSLYQTIHMGEKHALSAVSS